MQAGSRIVRTGLLAADDEVATSLQLDAGDFVFDLVRIRLADGTPISLEHVRLPATEEAARRVTRTSLPDHSDRPA